MVEGCGNLTVYLLRREQFETLRLGRVCPLPPRCVKVTYPSLAAAQIKFVPAPIGTTCSREPSPQPRPFPYDAPFPLRPLTPPLHLAYDVPPVRQKPVIKQYTAPKDIPGKLIDMFG